MALKSSYTSEEKGAEIEEALDALDALVDRVKVLYEQYFMGIQRQPPTHLHNTLERQLRDLQQANIRNTALRYRFITVQQKHGAYNAYWKRTLREIESGRYLRNLSKLRARVAVTGEALPEEILAKMPKRMREAVARDREVALAKAKREGRLPAAPPEASAPFERARHDSDSQPAMVISAPRPNDLELDAALSSPGVRTTAASASAGLARPSATVSSSSERSLLDDILGDDDIDLALAALADDVVVTVDRRARATQPPPMSLRPPAQPSSPSWPTAVEPPVVAAAAEPAPRPAPEPSASAVEPAPRPAPEPPASAVEPASVASPHPAVGLSPLGRLPLAKMPTRAVTERGSGPERLPSDVGPPAASPPRVVPPIKVLPPINLGVPGKIGVPSRIAAPGVSSPALGASPRAQTPPIEPPRAESPAAGRSLPAIPRLAASHPAAPPVVQPAPAPSVPVVVAGPAPSVPVVVAPLERAPRPEPMGSVVRPPRPAPSAPSSIPGMTEADTRALYAKYVKARTLVGESAEPMSYDRMVKTLSSQAPKILKDHQSTGVEFNVVVKDNKVVLKAKPK